MSTTTAPTHGLAESPAVDGVHYAICHCGLIGTSSLTFAAAREDMGARHITHTIESLGGWERNSAGTEFRPIPGRPGVLEVRGARETTRSRVWADGAVS